MTAKIYGRGTNDMKGAVAAMTAAASNYAKRIREKILPVRLYGGRG